LNIAQLHKDVVFSIFLKMGLWLEYLFANDYVEGNE